MEQLKDEMQQLRLTKDDLERMVSGLERKEVDPPKVRSERVKMWMKDVDSLGKEVEKLVECKGRLESSSQNESFVRGQLNDEIWKTVGKVRKLYNRVEELQRKGLVFEAHPEKFHELPGQSEDAVVGIDGKIEEVLQFLDGNEVELIGIHGMGGIGKTTLVKEVTKKLRSSETVSFEFVTSVVIPRDYTIKYIQEEIIVQLGYKRGSLPSWMNEDDRARFIWEKLRQKSFLLILDDIWECFDLSKVGYRYSSKNMEAGKKCKVMITSRSQDTCAIMGYGLSSKILKVDRLGKEDAWELFARKIGNDLHESYIPQAEKIANKCGGLPLLLKTVSRSMTRNRTYSDWVIAESQLDEYPDTIKGVDDVNKALKLSFDRLEKEELKYCLLYCALFPEDHDILIEELIPYLIADFWEEMDGPCDFDVIRRMATDIVWSLQGSSLLEKGTTDEHIKLHDSVRDMAIWLGKKEGAGEVRYRMLTFTGKERRGGGSIDVDESWVGVKMVSLMQNEIKQVHVVQSDEITSETVCVQTLLLNRYLGPPGGPRLPKDLFPLLSTLRILDLSYIRLQEVPKTIGSLKSLLHLNMSFSEIRKLPVEMKDLSNLHTLDLSYTKKLNYVPQHAISTLKKLRSLNLYGCPCLNFRKADGLKLRDLIGLHLLIDLGLVIRHVGDAEKTQFQCHTLSRSISKLCFSKIPDVDASSICSICSGLQRLELLCIFECKFLSGKMELDGKHFRRLKVLKLDGNYELNDVILTSPLFCLQELNIDKCGFEHLMWLQKLPDLRRVIVSGCLNLRDLKLPLLESMLEFLSLEDLPLLESISSSNILLPHLTEMYVRECPKLLKLPIKTCKTVNTGIECEKDWWESLEWGDDECSPSRFSPSDHSLSFD